MFRAVLRTFLVRYYCSHIASRKCIVTDYPVTISIEGYIASNTENKILLTACIQRENRSLNKLVLRKRISGIHLNNNNLHNLVHIYCFPGQLQFRTQKLHNRSVSYVHIWYKSSQLCRNYYCIKLYWLNISLMYYEISAIAKLYGV